MTIKDGFEYKSIFINKVEYSFKKKIGDINSKWVLIDTPMNEKDLEDINKKTKEFIGKAEQRATETNKKREKVQSGIHLEARVNLVFKLYLANLNEYLKANKDKKNLKMY